MFRLLLRYCGYAGLFAGRFILLPVYFLTGLLPRRKNLWVFGSWGGHRFADNAAAYFLYCGQHAVGVDLVWISRDRKIIERLRNAGYTAHWHWSPAGIRACLRAGTHIFDCFGKDTNFWLSRGAFRVCLWSGVPLKVFERDIRVSSSRYYRLFHGSLIERVVLGMMMPWHVKRPDRLIALSAETRDITARAFDVPLERVLITGFPRNDRFTSDDPPPALPDLRLPETLREAVAGNRKVVMYLPTYRDSGRPYSRLDWQHLDALMGRHQATFFYKFHPLDRSVDTVELPYVHRIDRERDVYDLLNSVDILISDYSSIAFDYALLAKPIVFYTPDLDDFLANCRSLNFHPRDIATKPLCMNYAELAEQVGALLDGSLTEDAERLAALTRRLHEHARGQASARIFAALAPETPADGTEP